MSVRLYPPFQTVPWRTAVFQSVGGATSTVSSRRYPQFLQADRVMHVWELPSGIPTSGAGRLFRVANMSGLQTGGPFFVNPLG